MKKIFSFGLVLLMVLAMAVPAFAYYEAAAKPEVKVEIKEATTAQKLDGVISDGEYYKVDVPKDSISIATYDESVNDRAKNLAFELYLSYDANNVYLASSIPADVYYCDGADPGSIWMYSAIQCGFATKDATANEFLEVGYGKDSTTGDLVNMTWAQSPYGTAEFTSTADKDYTVAVVDGKVIYEVAMPWTAFGPAALKLGDTFRVGFVAATGNADGYCHTQVGYGITGDEGKTVDGFVVATLAAAPAPETTAAPVTEAPVAPAPEAPAPAPEAPAAPQTSDTALIAFAVVATLSLAGVVVLKKAKR